MDPHTNNRSTILIVGLLLLAFSLPVNWFTIMHSAESGGVGAAFPFALGPTTVTGLDGDIKVLLLKLPIWLVVAFGMLSLVFLFLNLRRVTSLPRWTIVASGLLSLVYVAVGVGVGLAGDTVNIGLGPWLALGGLGLGGFVGVRVAKKA